MDNFSIRPYEEADGVKMLADQGIADEGFCAEAEGFSVVLGGKVILCAGLIKEREGVGQAWALYPLDVGKYHIDPKIARDKLHELMAEKGLWRVFATVRCDFPRGADYLRWMGFKREGRLEKNEPDKTDSFLYAITDRCLCCGKCCHLAYFDEKGKIVRTSRRCPNLTEKNLCLVYDHRPDWCMTARQMAELSLLPQGCGYLSKGDK